MRMIHVEVYVMKKKIRNKKQRIDIKIYFTQQSKYTQPSRLKYMKNEQMNELKGKNKLNDVKYRQIYT